ncbi:endonuclease/exonuclease/phosphatase family protein [Nocardioides pyridinolyticus]
MTGPSHRAPKAGRRTSRVAVAILALGVLVALLATVRLAGSDGGSTAADLGERVAATSSPTAWPSASASGSGAAVSRSAPTTAPPQKVVQAAVVKPKPPKVLERERVERIAAKQEAEVDAPFDVTIGTFNVLGSQHTAPGGDRRRYPPASVRTPGAASLIAAHRIDIVGTQELQGDQLAGLTSRTGLTAWPGTAWGAQETDNSILYDDGRFDYIEGTSFTVTFMGRPRPSPILKLRESASGREFYVVNTHLSAGGGRYATERRNGMATLVRVMTGLKATGLPVLLTGDMNDRVPFYCNVVSPAGLVNSNGGGAGCAPPAGQIPVDWVVGSGVTWSGYWRDTSSTTRRISDHIFVSATAHIA